MPAKRHHYNPCMHLEHFAGHEPAGQVWTYDCETGEQRSGKPENTAVQGHFYSIERDDGSMDTSVEDFLAQEIESPAAPVYKQLLAGIVPAHGSAERSAFARFLAYAHFRTPAMRKMAAEMQARELQILSYAYASNDSAFEGLNRRFEKETGRALSDEQKEKLRQGMLDPSIFTMQVTGESTLRVLDTAETLAPILHNMKWSLADARHGFFITTDNPLVRDVDPATRHPIYGDHGFMNKTVEVLFPLSPRRLLIMSWQDDAKEYGVFDSDHVDLVNRRFASRATRYLYAHVEHKKLTRLAREFPKGGPSIATSGYGPRNFAEIEVVRKLAK